MNEHLIKRLNFPSELVVIKRRYVIDESPFEDISITDIPDEEFHNLLLAVAFCQSIENGDVPVPLVFRSNGVDFRCKVLKRNSDEHKKLTQHTHL